MKGTTPVDSRQKPSIGKLAHPDLRIDSFHLGKVRNSVQLSNGTRVIQTSNRVSAFDVLLPFEVNEKAEILQALSLWFFDDTKHIVENHIIGALDKTHLLVKEAQVLPFEFVVRGVLTGSLWRLYSTKGTKGVFETYGVFLPDGMQKNQILPKPILTPTSKALAGHDMPRTPEALLGELHEFIEASALRLSPSKPTASALFETLKEKCFALYEQGQARAQERGLFLADTKYEFGLNSHGLLLVDEVHTPDSSRYWYLTDQCTTNTSMFVAEPKQLSKEFLRTELMHHFGDPNNLGPQLRFAKEFSNPEFVQTLASNLQHRYQEMFNTFLPHDTPFNISQRFFVPWPLTPKDVKTVTQNLQLPDRVLIMGNGGRDFALYQFFARLPEVSLVYCAPGNRAWPGAKYREVAAKSPSEIAKFAAENNIGLVISGPEQYLAEGLKEACAAYKIPCLGPNLFGAELEASKIICKNILVDADIPTAASQLISWSALLKEHSGTRGNHSKCSLKLPCALKFDGLAAGKGVFICHNEQDLDSAISSLSSLVPNWQKAAEILPANSHSKLHNEAYFLVEELLLGEEISVMALCNNTQFRLLPVARDYKRRNNGQNGPNTGGMGTVGPMELDENLLSQISEIFQRTLNTLAAQGKPYSGFLFAGIMVDKNARAWVIEFNCRLGDPETQVIVPGLDREFAVELFQTAKQEPFLLHHKTGTFLPHDNLKRVFVVGAAPEYP